MARQRERSEELDADLSDRALARHLGVPVWAATLLRQRLEEAAGMNEEKKDARNQAD
jgi:hypothetical protein